jgi:RNA polymerase sigma-70 factor (ECF subfamily)
MNMLEKNHSPELTAAIRFEKIYQATFFRLEHFVRSFIKREEAMHDVLQETYIRLWENLENLEDDDSLLPLLRTYATNVMINSLKKSAKEVQRAQVFYSRQELTCSSEEDLDLKENMQAYQQAVEALPPKRRQIYRLIHEEELTYKEIAEKLNISTHTIKYHIMEARKALLNEFSADKLTLAILLAELHRLV